MSADERVNVFRMDDAKELDVVMPAEGEVNVDDLALAVRTAMTLGKAVVIWLGPGEDADEEEFSFYAIDIED